MLTTNMWGNVTPEIGVARERQLAAEFVKPALDRGAQLRRHHDTTESAHQIIREILNNHRTQTPLQVQRELIDEGREFDHTTVGEEINREVNEHTKKLEGQIEELQSELRTVKRREKETRQQLNAEIAALRVRMDDLAQKSRDMNAGYERSKMEAATRFAWVFTHLPGIMFSAVLRFFRIIS